VSAEVYDTDYVMEQEIQNQDSKTESVIQEIKEVFKNIFIF